MTETTETRTLPPECFTTASAAVKAKVEFDGRKFWRFRADDVAGGAPVWCLASTSSIAERAVADYLEIKPWRVSRDEMYDALAEENLRLAEAAVEAAKEEVTP